MRNLCVWSYFVGELPKSMNVFERFDYRAHRAENEFIVVLGFISCANFVNILILPLETFGPPGHRLDPDSLYLVSLGSFLGATTLRSCGPTDSRNS